MRGSAMPSVRVARSFIGLDNLWDGKQRDALLPESQPNGSLLIMTARDKSLLTYGGQKEGQRQAVSCLIRKP